MFTLIVIAIAALFIGSAVFICCCVAAAESDERMRRLLREHEFEASGASGATLYESVSSTTLASSLSPAPRASDSAFTSGADALQFERCTMAILEAEHRAGVR